METINVAVGIIYRTLNDSQQILISYRHAHLHQGDLWEFPGGKIENNETLSEALSRELKEELGIQVIHQKALFEINHNYSDKKVCLKICLVEEFTGKATGKEQQQIKWVGVEDLAGFEFPEANTPIVEFIRKNL